MISWIDNETLLLLVTVLGLVGGGLIGVAIEAHGDMKPAWYWLLGVGSLFPSWIVALLT